MIFIFSILLGCTVSGHNVPFYSLPTHHGFLPAPVFHHRSPIFAPLEYYVPQPLIYQQPLLHAPIERVAYSAPNPYQGFAYRTRLSDDATMNAFFLSGAYKPEQIEQIFARTQKTENNEEKPRSLANVIENIFANQDRDFQYIYRPSLHQAIPTAQRSGKAELERKETPAPTEASTEINEEKEKAITIKPSETTEIGSTEVTASETTSVEPSSSSTEAKETDSTTENTTTVSESTTS
ncbi:uncharacterized protein LOC116165600 isoform X2 [Photinus pyralis]|uniref:uncharacterized protein LOC116165600 isoform X2 n=1 Tax=Photinus pyralis TaxID=7054 RepID=UPI0012675857|nr:uncharacterized protein LOC116165600 isoform X2 [Photinus pyralis]